MFTVNSDKGKNRLYITLEAMEKNDIKPILDSLASHIAELDSGFSCLVDIRKMSVDPLSKGSEYIEIIQGALNDAGMGKVVRVIDKSNIVSHSQMEETSSTIGYSGTPAYTVEEAEQLLDKM